MVTNSRTAIPSPDLPTRSLSVLLGLTFVGERALSREEIAELEGEAHKYKKQSAFFGWLTFWVFATPFLLGFLCSIVSPGGVNPRYDHVTDMVVGFVIVPLLSASVLFWLLSYEGQRRGKQGLAWDLRAGVVQQFQGRAHQFKDRRFATRLFAPNSALSSADAVHLIEVLPHAQRLWKIDGARVVPWKVLDKATKPAPPPAVAIDELLASSVPTSLPVNIPIEVVGERELTAIEREELRRHLKSPSTSAMFFRMGLFWLIVWIGQRLVDYLFHNQPLTFSPTLLVVPALFFFLGMLTVSAGPGTKRQLRQDMVEGRALKIYIPTSPHALPASQRQGIHLEILPHTRWVWTGEEQPPHWRAKPQQRRKKRHPTS